MAEGEATILVLDDNMPLRSMRYEYYQLARTCKFNHAGAYKERIICTLLIPLLPFMCFCSVNCEYRKIHNSQL